MFIVSTSNFNLVLQVELVACLSWVFLYHPRVARLRVSVFVCSVNNNEIDAYRINYVIIALATYWALMRVP